MGFRVEGLGLWVCGYWGFWIQALGPLNPKPLNLDPKGFGALRLFILGMGFRLWSLGF